MNVPKERKAVIFFFILVAALGLFFWMSILQNNFLEQNKLIICSVFLAIVVLGLSVYVSLRTSFLHSSIAADVNIYSNTLLADTSSGRKRNSYQEIAKEWLKFSEASKYTAKLRVYSARSCFWSLIFLVITFLLFLFPEEFFWIIPFGIAVVFFILSLLILVFRLDHVFLQRLLAIFPLLYPELPRYNEIADIIEKHEWLKNCLWSK